VGLENEKSLKKLGPEGRTKGGADLQRFLGVRTIGKKDCKEHKNG